jgi:chromosome segregation ATPase
MVASSSRISPLHALGAYTEPLARGARVVVLGDSSDDLGARLAALGARLVHVYDPDSPRAQRHTGSRAVLVRELPPGDFDVREGAFDLAIVPDLRLFADPAALMSRVRRLVGPRGTAIVGVANDEAEGLGYYELFDLVTMQFATVRMVGQVPFTGITFADLGETEGEIPVTVDAQLAGTPPAPSMFLALGSQQAIDLDRYAIIQVPTDLAELTGALGRSEGPALEEARVALAEAKLRAEVLETRLEELRARPRTSPPSPRISELETALAQQVSKVQEADGRAGDNHVRAERLTHDLRTLEQELERQRDRGFRLTRELEDEKKAKQKAELELGMVRKNPELSLLRERAGSLEASLREAREASIPLQGRIAELEGSLASCVEQLARMASELTAARKAAEVSTSAHREFEARQLRAAEQHAARVEAEAARHGEAQAREISELEAALRDRAQALASMGQEVVRRERMIQELVGALEEAGGQDSGQNSGRAVEALRSHNEELRHELSERDRVLRIAQLAEQRLAQELVARDAGLLDGKAECERHAREAATLRGKLDALAAEAARREGDVHATQWRIAELEGELAAFRAESPLSGSEAHDIEQKLSSALDQLDLLKQALTQEHEARERSESGQELVLARAELQRQATLLEQLTRELGLRSMPASQTP